MFGFFDRCCVVSERGSAVHLGGILMRVGSDDVDQRRLLMRRSGPTVGTTGIEVPGRRRAMRVVRARKRLVGTQLGQRDRSSGSGDSCDQVGVAPAKFVGSRAR
jgi:hypothetical protein